MDIHPLGTRARVLLCSVFGPYAQYDRFGSRKDNLMELFHNQITLAEGPFSIRSFYPTIALQLMSEKLSIKT